MVGRVSDSLQEISREVDYTYISRAHWTFQGRLPDDGHLVHRRVLLVNGQ